MKSKVLSLDMQIDPLINNTITAYGVDFTNKFKININFIIIHLNIKIIYYMKMIINEI